MPQASVTGVVCTAQRERKMARRLALLAASDYDGAWIRASGDEAFVRVRGLGVGDKVWMTVLTPETEHRIPLEEGNVPLTDLRPARWSRYRVSKIAGGSGHTTTVEVVLG